MNSTVIPCLQYRDAQKMVDWLCDTFGFARHAVYPDGNGGVMHAELTLDAGMIMIGTYKKDEAFGRVQSMPDLLGGTTQSPYLVVADADAIYARARAAGADIVLDIETKGYGGRGFSCRDPEGHLWSVGTYDPWKPQN